MQLQGKHGKVMRKGTLSGTSSPNRIFHMNHH